MSTALDSLLSMVDPPKPSTELPASVKAAAEQAGKTAYYDARKANATPAAAQDAAARAFTAAAEQGLRALEDEGDVAPVVVAPKILAPVAPIVRGVTVDAEGARRHEESFAAAVKAGFSPEHPLYTPGTMVVDVGVANARRSRMEHDAKPLVVDACADFIAKIAAENRAIVTVNADDIGMRDDGQITASGQAYPIEERALIGLTSRLGYGGGQYLAKCPPDLRAFNVNRWRAAIATSEHARARAAIVDARVYEPKQIALRTRNGSSPRSVFAAVTPSYTPFDADLIAAAIAQATPKDARGGVTYDGAKSRFEIGFHSTVQPKHYVCGEFFRAGAVVRTDDTGGGSVIVSAMVMQNLCLNLIILDRADQVLARIRHVGSLAQLTAKFRRAFAKAIDSIGHFLKAWGYACEEHVVNRTGVAKGGTMPLDEEEQLAGLFNGILERGLVKVPGRRADTVKQLLTHHEWDKSGAKLVHAVSRASIVNAFTRFAHQELTDPWAVDEVERDAGRLLYALKGDGAPAPLPFLDPSIAEDATPRPAVVA